MASYLVGGNEVLIVDGDEYKIVGEIPPGAYKVDFHKMRGTFLTKTEIKLSHGKIYSKSQSIADHIVESYKKNDPTKNMGVLLSGDRGLGKTLTSRLVIEQLIKDHPVIMCSMYTPDLADFLSNVKNAVILMDEFEKFMSGNIKGNDAEDEQTKQETILSVLDGNTGSAGNLYLLTVNNVYKLDDNLKSRPGRIRYHYKYVSETADVVRNYCIDNLNDKSQIEEVVKTLGSAKYVSMDIISSFVKEMNDFPGSKPTEILEYLNIEQDTDGSYTMTIKLSYEGRLYSYSCKANMERLISGQWFKRKITDEEKKIKLERREAAKSSEDKDYYYEEEDDEEPGFAPTSIYFRLVEEDAPSYVYNTEELLSDSVEIIYAENCSGEEECMHWIDEHEVKILKVIIKDDDFTRFSRKYNKIV
jgi:hypothetical protein